MNDDEVVIKINKVNSMCVFVVTITPYVINREVYQFLPDSIKWILGGIALSFGYMFIYIVRKELRNAFKKKRKAGRYNE